MSHCSIWSIPSWSTKWRGSTPSRKHVFQCKDVPKFFQEPENQSSGFHKSLVGLLIFSFVHVKYIQFTSMVHTRVVKCLRVLSVVLFFLQQRTYIIIYSCEKDRTLKSTKKGAFSMTFVDLIGDAASRFQHRANFTVSSRWVWWSAHGVHGFQPANTRELHRRSWDLPRGHAIYAPPIYDEWQL